MHLAYNFRHLLKLKLFLILGLDYFLLGILIERTDFSHFHIGRRLRLWLRLLGLVERTAETVRVLNQALDSCL